MLISYFQPLVRRSFPTFQKACLTLSVSFTAFTVDSQRFTVLTTNSEIGSRISVVEVIYTSFQTSLHGQRYMPFSDSAACLGDVKLLWSLIRLRCDCQFYSFYSSFFLSSRLDFLFLGLSLHPRPKNASVFK